MAIKMNIRPSSSTGVLFALVYNNTVPLTVAVVTQGEEDAVSSFTLLFEISTCISSCIHAYCIQAQTHMIKLCDVLALHVPEPASVLGRRLCGNAGLTHVVLPRTADTAPECDSHRNPNLSQLLHSYLHEV